MIKPQIMTLMQKFIEHEVFFLNFRELRKNMIQTF